jgi:transposase
MGLFLTAKEIEELKADHRAEEKRRYADRIKSVLLLDQGMVAEEVARILLLDEKTVRRYHQLYESGGLEGLCIDEIVGKQSRLSDEQEEELKLELRNRIFLSSGAVIAHVESKYGILYSTSGIVALLHRLNFSYKKPKVIPGKANAEAQEKFLEMLEKLKDTKGEENPLYYGDGVHPQHNSMPAYGWMPRGEDTELKSNTGRKRVNLNGALNAETKEIVVTEHVTLNAQSTIVLLTLLESLHPEAKKIYLVVDNAKYYKAKVIKEFLLTSRVVLVFLPPYAPNLNLIERVWKFFKKKILANRYYEKYADFREACLEFFEPKTWLAFRSEWTSLLTDNFQIIGA